MSNYQVQYKVNNKFNPNQKNANFESSIVNPINYTPEETQDYSNTQASTILDKPLIAEETGYYDEDEESFSEEVKKIKFTFLKEIIFCF